MQIVQNPGRVPDVIDELLAFKQVFFFSSYVNWATPFQMRHSV